MELLKKPDLEARIAHVYSRLVLLDEPDLFSPMGRKSPQTLGKSSVCGPREMEGLSRVFKENQRQSVHPPVTPAVAGFRLPPDRKSEIGGRSEVDFRTASAIEHIRIPKEKVIDYLLSPHYAKYRLKLKHWVK